MTRVAVVLLASLFAGCATGAARTVVTLPPLFVCDRAVYWYDHPPVKPAAVPRFPVPLNLLYFARPNYPYEARRKLMEGTMLLEMRIKPDGTVGKIKILQHPRYPLLELAARQGLRQWRFAHGTPARVRIPVTFSLRCAEYANTPNQAMQLTASKPVVYAGSVCRRERMLRGMRRGLAAADLVSR